MHKCFFVPNFSSERGVAPRAACARSAAAARGAGVGRKPDPWAVSACAARPTTHAETRQTRMDAFRVNPNPSDTYAICFALALADAAAALLAPSGRPWCLHFLEQHNWGVQAQTGGMGGSEKVAQLQQFWQEQMRATEQVTDFKSHSLPLARIKKIMKSDEDVRMISSEAPALFAKACEMFILELTLRSWNNAEDNKRRTLQKDDIAAALNTVEVFDFLVDVVPQAQEQANVAAEAAAGGGAPGAAVGLEAGQAVAAAAAAAAAQGTMGMPAQQYAMQYGMAGPPMQMMDPAQFAQFASAGMAALPTGAAPAPPPDGQ